MRCNQKLTSSLGAIATLFFFQPLAIAETKSLTFQLASNSNQSFKSLMQQAELLATDSITQEFARQHSVTAVAVTVIGERNGQQVPILIAKVSRLDWQTQPNIQLWTKYFAKAAILLGFKPLPKTKPNVNIQLPIVTNSAKPVPADDPGYRDD